MTRAETISLALEVGFNPMSSQEMDMFERFAALVFAAKREECAKVCEQMASESDIGRYVLMECADAIRARGEHE